MFIRKQFRLKNYNYSLSGYYFVTICTQDKVNYFGKYQKNQIILDKSGELAKQSWLEIPDHYNNIEIDKFIIMPNHIHGIIIIKDVGDRLACPTLENKYQLLSKVIGGYKAGVSRVIRSRGLSKAFKWQRSFYDRVIRNESELKEIRLYIKNNALK